MKPDINATKNGPLPYKDGDVLIKHYNAESTTGEPLVIPVTLLCNTDDAVRKHNIAVNSRQQLPWLNAVPAHCGVAVLCGSGPSIRDHANEIAELKEHGATVFALNGAALWLNELGLVPDYQVMIDARRENMSLLGDAHHYLMASQCHPDVVDEEPFDTTLVHMLWEHLDECLPDDECERDYTVVGCGASVGIVATFIAYAMGYRKLELYGYDSSHKTLAESHVRRQEMNDGEPCAQVVFGGKTYLASLVMKQQAEQFATVRHALNELGVSVNVHGTGLLPDMLKMIDQIDGERAKYEAIWSFDAYRTYSPALEVVDQIAAFLPVGVEVADYGCGTGKAAVALAERGFKPVLIDFAENCRDPQAMKLWFVQADLSRPIPVETQYGYCCDVMEHIPADQVHDVLDNISASSSDVFFRIETSPDAFGALIGKPLHLSVHPESWWLDMLKCHWDDVEAKGDGVFLCRSNKP